MMRLWEDLLDGLDTGSLGFAARSDCYALIQLLLRRAELGCTLDDTSSSTTPVSHVLRWRVLQQRTLTRVLQFVDDPPAGGDGPALRDFCAVVMAHSYFRLPQVNWMVMAC